MHAHNESSSYQSLADTLPVELIAVCDALVLKALESVGKRIVRVSGERHNILRPQPFYNAHTIWKTSESEVKKATRGAFVVLTVLSARYQKNSSESGYVSSDVLSKLLYAYVQSVVSSQSLHTPQRMLAYMDSVISHPSSGLVYTIDGQVSEL